MTCTQHAKYKATRIRNTGAWITCTTWKMYSNAAYMHRISVSSLDDLQKCSTHVQDFYEELECCRAWMNCNNAVRRNSVRSWSTGAWMTCNNAARMRRISVRSWSTGAYMTCNNAVRMRRISVRSWSTGAWMTSIWSPVVSTPTTGPGGSSQRKRTRWVLFKYVFSSMFSEVK